MTSPGGEQTGVAIGMRRAGMVSRCALLAALWLSFGALAPVEAQDAPRSRTIEDLIEGQGIYGHGGAAPETSKPALPTETPETAPQQPQAPTPAGETPPAVTTLSPVPDAPAAPEVLAAPSITWRVANQFRFFTDPAHTDVHRAVYQELTPEEREKSPVLSAEHRLARRFDDGWAAAMFRNTCWDGSRNRYGCEAEPDYAMPKSHEVILSLSGLVDGGAGVDCTWSIANLPAGRAREEVTKPCAETVRYDIPYPKGARVTVSVGGQEVANTDVRVKDLFIVGMGDSFGSGEGNPDLPVRFSPDRAITYGKAGQSGLFTGYPARVGDWKQVGDKDFIEQNARWLDQACHRSLYSFEMRAALQLAIEDPHRAVTYAGYACSGAEVTFGLFLRYKGNEWVPKPPDLSQISAAADLQCAGKEAPWQDLPEAYHMNGSIPELQGGLTLKKCAKETARKIDLLLLSIGGNDIGFARLVANAVLNDSSLIKSLGGWFGQVHGNKESEELLARLDDRYKAMNRAVHGILHIPWNEADRVLLMGYPPLAILDESGKVCPDGTAGMEVFNDFYLKEKEALSSSWLADKLDQVMEKSAKSHGWSYIEGHRKEFVGRGLCAGTVDGRSGLPDDLRLPRKTGDLWVPYNPALFQAYASRQRWFRTPNDAFMTGNFHVAGSVMQKVLKLQSFSWFQVLLASTYSGAFHPTAEGHAAMADAAVRRARRVLAKYGDGTETPPEPTAENSRTARP